MKKRTVHSLWLLGILEMILLSFVTMGVGEISGFMLYTAIFLIGILGLHFSSLTIFPINLLILFKKYCWSRTDFIKKVNKWIEQTKLSQSNEEFYIFSIDIDRFRWIQNSLGYKLGGQLLNTIIHRLMDFLNDDSFVTRYSGDQFLLFIPKNSTEEDHETLAATILERLYQPYMVRGTEINITCSLGIGIYPEHGTSGASVLTKANFALQLAKENGRNQLYTFRFKDEEKTRKKMMLERELKKAIKNNQFTINYQPQISLQTGKICGAEALLRWNHPIIGNVSPVDFIPLAEETGLIGQLGGWVLKNAAKQFKAWETEGVDLDSISVNISMAEFLNEELISSVLDTLKEVKMDPGKLKLEITESMAMNQMDIVLKKLYDLKKTGIQLAIDDFGTGYSSLRYLNALPVDYLKVDQSFVRHIKRADEEAVITKSIIQMAKGLHLKVVAEGVETIEQRDYVKKLGCDEFQGFFHSPPLTAEAFKTAYKKNIKNYIQNNEHERMLFV